MSRLTPISHRKLAKILNQLGFIIIRQKGSHQIWKHEDGRITVVPCHSNIEIDVGLLSKILSDIELSRAELERIRK